MDISDIKWKAMSDGVIMQIMGTFIKHNRLEQNKTQSQLAEEAGINRSTLSDLERGKRSNTITLIQLLRALKLLHVLETFQVQQQLSPIQLAKMEQAQRKRATKSNNPDATPKSDW